MTVSLCPLCQSPLRIFAHRSVECEGWNCQFKIPTEDSRIIAEALAHHMRPLETPHEYREETDYPGTCCHDLAGIGGGPVRLCNRPKECH